jgi:predicted ATPase
LRFSLSGQNFSNLSFQCSVLHRDSPLHPVTRSITQIAALSDDDSPEIKWRKLEILFENAGENDRQGISLLAAHLGVPVPTDKPQAILASENPERRRMVLHRLLTDFVVMLARRHPVLITCEDIHWMDPTTSEFLETLITRIPEEPVLLIITFRPKFSPPWQDPATQTVITLDRLNRGQTVEFINVFAITAQLPRDVVAELIERSDGNPLYIEELTAAVFAGRRTEKITNFSGPRAKNRVKIPSTLQESLLARIDQTSPQARELIQVCAVIGRRFSR